MSTRYQALREAIRLLAAPAQEQIVWLEWLLSDVATNGSARNYGNLELIENCYDIILARDHMRECGELTDAEVVQVSKIHALFDNIRSYKDEGFWDWEALNSDQRWDAIRDTAAEVLTALPDEPRESEWTKKFWVTGSGKAIPAAK